MVPGRLELVAADSRYQMAPCPLDTNHAKFQGALIGLNQLQAHSPLSRHLLAPSTMLLAEYWRPLGFRAHSLEATTSRPSRRPQFHARNQVPGSVASKSPVLHPKWRQYLAISLVDGGGWWREEL